MALVLVFSAGASVGAVTARPALRVVAVHPLVVKGNNFVGGERVRVVATADGDRAVARTRAGSAGSFVATFTQFAFNPCQGPFVIRATGSARSRAVLVVAHGECSPRLETTPRMASQR
jgi:hypothetical protein